MKKAVWECGDEKSPGPDGFSIGLLNISRRFLNLIFVELFLIFRLNRGFLTDATPHSFASFQRSQTLRNVKTSDR